MISFPKSILILGMHRSGTSALAAGIQLAIGAAMGPLIKENLLENPKGFFEVFDIVNLNDRVLHSFGGSWDSIVAADSDAVSCDVLTKHRKEAINIVQKLLKNKNYGQ